MAASVSTQPSLLLRIRDERDHDSWSQFVEVYTPLVYAFLRKQGLQDADAADVAQDVLTLVATAISSFEYDRQKGSFRGWLFSIVRNRLRRFLDQGRRRVAGSGGTEAYQSLQQQPDPAADAQSVWDRDYRRHLFQWAARRVKNDFQDSTWRAFQRVAVEGDSAAAVAADLGLSVAAVYMAKRRVLKRLQEQISELQGASCEDD